MFPGYHPQVEENGLSEASSPLHENTGFMAYNALAGGVLTGKYLDRRVVVVLHYRFYLTTYLLTSHRQVPRQVSSKHVH